MLSKKNWVSNLSFKQITDFSLPYSTVHTNTTPTVIINSYVLQKPPFCNNGYKVKFVEQIVTSASFWPKKWDAETLKTIVCQTALLTKFPPGGFLFIHEIWCFQPKCHFFKESSLSSLRHDILLQKLSYYCITNKLKLLLESYLIIANSLYRLVM